MSENLIAGTLEIPVEADLSTFEERLRAKVEEAAKGITAKIRAVIDGDQLREDLQEDVKKAAEGVEAKVGIGFDADTLRERLLAAVKAAAHGVAAEIGVTVNGEGLRARIQAEAKKAAAGVDADVEVDVESQGLRARFKAAIERATAGLRARVPVVPTGERAGPGFPGGGSESLLARLSGRGSPMGTRMLLRLALIMSVLSLIGPAITTLAGSLAGLSAMVANLAVSVQTLSAAPLIFSALGLAVGSVLVAFSGMTGELKDLRGPMRAVRLEVESLADEWAAARRQVQDSFWSQIENHLRHAGEIFLPQLGDALAAVGQQVGMTGQAFLHWVQSDEFKTEFAANVQTMTALLADFRRALFGIDPAMGDAGEATGGLIQWLSDLMIASRPITARFGAMVQQFGLWTASLLDSKEERDAFAADLDYAADKGAQAGRIIRELWQGIVGIFTAGRGSGDSLLASLEESLTKFSEWTTSPQGAARIEEFFRNIEAVTRSTGSLIVELGRSIGRLAEDQGVAALIDMIRDDFLPAATEFLQSLGAHLGPQVVTFLTQALTAFSNFAGEGGPLVPILAAINTFLTNLNNWYDAQSPADQEKLQNVAAGLMAIFTALIVAKKLGLLGVLTGVISGIRGLLGAAAGAGIAGAAGAAGAGAGKGAAGKGVGGFFGNLMGRGGILVRWIGAPTVTAIGAGAIGGKGGVAGGKGGPRGTAGGRHRATTLGGRLRSGAGKLGGGALAGLTVGSLGSWISSLLGDGNGGGRDLWSRIIGEAGTGAGIGATLGSIVPGVGTLFGGLLGGGVGAATGSGLGRFNPFSIPGLIHQFRTGWSDFGFLGRLFGGGGGPANPTNGPGRLLTPETEAELERMFGGGQPGQYGIGSGQDSPYGAISPMSSVEYRPLGASQDPGGLQGILQRARERLDEFTQSVTGPVAGGLRTAGSTAVNALASALPPGVQTALRNLGLFKQNADGSVRVDLAGAGSAVATTLASALPPGVQSALVNLGVFKRDADGRVRVDLAGAGAAVVNTLANSLPKPVQKSLENLGVFQRNADGSVRVDLSRAGAAVANTLANSLPKPVQGALTNLGVFKKNADGSVSVDLAGTGRTVVGSLAGALPRGIQTALGAIGVFSSGAPGRATTNLSGQGRGATSTLSSGINIFDPLGRLSGFAKSASKYADVNLWGTGLSIIRSLGRGIEAGFGGIRSTLTSLTSLIPKWKGPEPVDKVLLTPAGETIMGSLLAGLRRGWPTIRSFLGAVTTDIGGMSGTLAGVTAAGLSARTGLLSPAGGNGVHLYEGAVQVHNPTAEPASESVASSLRRIGELGFGF